MSDLDTRIAALPDEQAISVLALVLQRQGHPVDPFVDDSTERQLRQALTDPDLPKVPVEEAATHGQLARTALTYLAGQDAALVDQALQLGPRADRFDPATLAVGALVLLAFRVDLRLAHDPVKGWTFSSAPNRLATTSSVRFSVNSSASTAGPTPDGSPPTGTAGAPARHRPALLRETSVINTGFCLAATLP